MWQWGRKQSFDGIHMYTIVYTLVASYSQWGGSKGGRIYKTRGKHTELIPGRLSNVPMTGTLLKKLTATGRKPLKKKHDSHYIHYDFYFKNIDMFS